MPLLSGSNVVEPAKDVGGVVGPQVDGEPKLEGRIEALTGLRGLMALYVTLEHLALSYEVAFHPAVDAVLTPFSLGVPGHALFFVLTGFGLTRSMIRQDRARVSPSLGEYLTARWRRLAPPYYATIALCLAIPALAHADGRLIVRLAPPNLFYQLLSHVLFVHGLHPSAANEFSAPLWSLSLIFQFYLIFPLLYTAMERWDYRAVAAGLIALWLTTRVLLDLLALSQGVPPEIFLGFILYRLPTFTLGMAVAYWASSPRRGQARRPTPIALGLTAALLLGGSVFTQGGGYRAVTELLHGFGYTALLLAALTAARRGDRFGRSLSRPALAGLGMISYSLYLTHDLVLSRLCAAYRYLMPDPGLVSDAALVAVGLVLCLSVARALYSLIEKRSVRIGLVKV